MPSGYPRYSTFDELGKRNTIALKKILDSGRDDGVEAVKKVIDLYQSCLNTTAIDLADAQPLLELLNHTGTQSFSPPARVERVGGVEVIHRDQSIPYIPLTTSKDFSK